MGRIVASELKTVEDIKIVAGVERQDHPEIDSMVEDVKVFSDAMEIPDADVWLDFSLAAPAMVHVRKAASVGKPVIVAATGFSPVDDEEFHWQSKLCPLLIAPNLSAGMGAMENICVQAAHLLPKTFDAGLVELHHKTKKDAPSGTALRIADKISAYKPVTEILSLRAGGAIGEHQVRFVGQDEEVIIIHRAWSRRAFSSGVERAVRFIARQPAGYYTPQDIYTTD